MIVIYGQHYEKISTKERRGRWKEGESDDGGFNFGFTIYELKKNRKSTAH
jgi:hypothetical protein